MMEQAFVLMVVGATSVGAYLLGGKGCGLPAHKLWRAVAKACEYVGLMVVFAVVNVAVGMLAVFGVRWLTGQFVSLYVASDMTLVILSVPQALIFQAWRDISRLHRTSGGQGELPVTPPAMTSPTCPSGGESN
jgi:hypothetical protein